MTRAGGAATGSWSRRASNPAGSRCPQSPSSRDIGNLRTGAVSVNGQEGPSADPGARNALGSVSCFRMLRLVNSLLHSMARLGLGMVAVVLMAWSPVRAAERLPVRVLVLDERQPQQKTTYTHWLGNKIAGHLRTVPGLSVTSTSIGDPQQGLATLDQTDVLVWWGHVRHMEIEPRCRWTSSDASGREDCPSSPCTRPIGRGPLSRR
jgi:hypothetical protein